MINKSSLLAFTILFAIPATTPAQSGDSFLTWYETHGFNHTPRYEQTVQYATRLAEASSLLTYTTIGTSAQGRAIPLLILDRDGLHSPKEIRDKGRVIVLAQAAIHAGEPDGKDAGLMLLRDIVIRGQYRELLDSVSLLFIPILNVDGHEDFGTHYRINQNGPEEVGSRNTAQRLNLNRDFIKAETPEMRAWLRLYGYWMPELLIDIHVTNGADFQYVATYGLDQCGYLESPLGDWSRQVYETELNKAMQEVGYPLFPYFDFVDYTSPLSGVMPSNFTPQYSNGYAQANNRIGLLLENHIYKPYKERVTAAYHVLLSSMRILSRHVATLKRLVAQTDLYVSGEAFRKDSFPLVITHDKKENRLVDYLAWEEKTVVSDLSGAPWTYIDHTAPVTLQIPYYMSYKQEHNVKLPRAYIIPQEQRQTLDLLDAHGIFYERCPANDTLLVETYRFINPRWSPYPYEGRLTLSADYQVQIESVPVRKGDIVVPTAQPKVKVVAHMLEPKSTTSLVYWGFYNAWARPETEFWVRLNYMEIKGREMLTENPALREAFEQKKAMDPAFASNPQAILQFFMNEVRQQVERAANRYPVLRLM